MGLVSNGRWLTTQRLACVSALGLAFLACSAADDSANRPESSAAELSAGGPGCGVAAEGQSTTLSCASGTISKLVFASYGRPHGTCGAYMLGTCDASSSRSVVESRCLGKASCSISATNGLFGDPCVGRYKHRYVQFE